MVNASMLVFLVILAHFSILPVSCLLPINGDGSPMPFQTVKSNVGKLPVSEVRAVTEKDIWKLGLDLLKQYCQMMSNEDAPKFTEACRKIYEIYKMKFDNSNYYYVVSNGNFPSTDHLERYLQRIEEGNIQSLDKIATELKKAVIWVGWNEIKIFCDLDDNWNKKEGCQFVQDVDATTSLWNLQRGNKLHRQVTDHMGHLTITIRNH